MIKRNESNCVYARVPNVNALSYRVVLQRLDVLACDLPRLSLRTSFVEADKDSQSLLQNHHDAVMAPSRGGSALSNDSHPPTDALRSNPTPGQAPASSPNSAEAKERHALKQEHSAASSVRQNLAYLWNPATVAATERPSRLRTRALLRSLRSIGIFIYWRLYRWAKYAIVGAVVGAVGSFAFAGTLATGVGAIIAPPGILASIAVGGIWWAARWGWNRAMHKRGKGRITAEPQVHPRVAEREPELVPW